MPTFRTLALALLVAAPVAIRAQIVNGSFEDDPYRPGVPPTGWTGGEVIGKSAGAPATAFPWGKDGNCAASLPPGASMSQSLTLQPGHAYVLRYWGEAAFLGGNARVRARARNSSGFAIAESTSTLAFGSAQPEYFKQFTLYIPPAATTAVAIEFANVTGDSLTTAVIDLVSLEDIPLPRPPVIDPPAVTTNKIVVTWSDSFPAHVPQTAPTPRGPWSDVSLLTLRTNLGKRSLDIPRNPSAPAVFVRTRPVQ